LAAKFEAIDPPSTGWRLYLEPNVHDIISNVYDDEGFDLFEYNELIAIQADITNTGWYKNSVYEDMYNAVDKSRIVRSSTLDMLGYPPVSGVTIKNDDKSKVLSDAEIKLASSNYNSGSGNITYAIPYWASLDYALIQNYLAEKKSNGQSLNSKEQGIITTQVRHRVTKGDYPIIVKYKLAGTNHISSATNIKMHNPID
jgi:hypothetical protein